MLHDPLNDAMATIKNAEDVGKMDCVLKPSSKLIGSVLGVMQENGYIDRFEYIEDGRAGLFRVSLNGRINDCGVIKPRFSVKKKDIERFVTERFAARFSHSLCPDCEKEHRT